MDFRYSLAKYSGKKYLLECPNCGQREFVPYIDNETGEILDPSCGRCNRLTNCAYHLTPRDYFQNHPEARPQGEPWRQTYRPQSFRPSIPVRPKQKEPTAVCVLPPTIVEKTLKLKPESHFVQFLDTLFDPLIVEGLTMMYHLGVTKDLSTIFYQIDRKGRYRGGKIIQYDPVTGHRRKGAANANDVTWVHSMLKPGTLPVNWKMTQCLFGEHLLDEYPDRVVVLVEAEKTAVIGAGFAQDCIWLATGGMSQLGDKLDVLENRKVLVYPDIDAHDRWVEEFQKRPYLSVTISDFLVENATDEDRAAQIDIADWLIHYARVPAVPPLEGTEHFPAHKFTNPIAADVAKYFPARFAAEIEALVEDFDLVPVSFTSTPIENPEEQ